MTPRHDYERIARNNRRLNVAAIVLILIAALAYFFAKNDPDPTAPIRPTKFVRTA